MAPRHLQRVCSCYRMQRKLEDVYFVDCTSGSGPGIAEYLFKNDVKSLLWDEVEKMSKATKCIAKCDGNRNAYLHKGEKNRK